MKVYLTEEALADQGIIIVADTQPVAMAGVVKVPASYGKQYHHKPHWHMTWQEAMIQARCMQVEKIVSLERSLARVRALTFPDTEPEETKDE